MASARVLLHLQRTPLLASIDLALHPTNPAVEVLQGARHPSILKQYYSFIFILPTNIFFNTYCIKRDTIEDSKMVPIFKELNSYQ